MHSFTSHGITYDWQRRGEDQIELRATWMDGPLERSTILLMLRVDELRLLLDTGKMVLLERTGKEPDTS